MPTSSHLLTDTLVTTLDTALAHVEKRPLPLHEPWFCGNEVKYTTDCIETGWVSSVGSYVDRFSIDLAKATGFEYAIPTVNGTAALHLGLKLLGIGGHKQEVLVPALTFVATANAIAYTGATPHFVDSDTTTLGVDADALRNYLLEISEQQDGQCINKATQKQIKALVVVHIFGHPADLDALKAVCTEFNIILVEDIAESLGSTYKSKHTGHAGELAALSFNGNKIITTGGGGAILTNNAELAQKAKHLSTTAKVPHPYAFKHDQVGYNYRMPNLNAALGCAQLENLIFFINKKRQLAKHYQQQFSSTPIQFIHEPKETQSNYWLCAIRLPSITLEERNQAIEACHQKGFLVRPAWNLLNQLPMFDHCPSMPLPQAQQLAIELINLPSSAFLAL